MLINFNFWLCILKLKYKLYKPQNFYPVSFLSLSMQESLGGALFACQILRKLSTLSSDLLQRDKLAEKANEFEDFAIELVTQCSERRICLNELRDFNSVKDASYNAYFFLQSLYDKSLVDSYLLDQKKLLQTISIHALLTREVIC